MSGGPPPSALTRSFPTPADAGAETMEEMGAMEDAKAQDRLEFVALDVRGHAYALPISFVLEFKTWMEPAPLPNAPPQMLGIVNIRGEVVPVFDVGARLGYGRTVPGPKHVITLAATSRDQVIGLLVDDVSDIISCSRTAVTTLPPDEDEPGTAVIDSVLRIRHSVIGIIDVDLLCDDRVPDPPGPRDILSLLPPG